MNSHAYESDRSRPTTRSSPGLASWYTQGRSDGLGDRLLMTDNTGAESLELLRFHAAFADAFGFERALREQVERLDRFQHAAFPRIRAVEYLEDGDGLALVCTHIAGTRLSEMFRSPRLRPALNPAFATWLVRQLTSAVADLQNHGRGIAHGALTADRVVLTPERKLVVVEQVLGPAVEGLNLTGNRLWSDIGTIAVPAPDGTVHLDAHSDVVQIGLMALSVVLGRRVGPDEYPAKLSALLFEFGVVARQFALVEPLRLWIERALRVDGHGFRNARDARDGLGELPGEVGHKQLDEASTNASPAEGSPAGVASPATEPSRPRHATAADRKAGIVVPIYPADPALGPADELSPFELNQPTPVAAAPAAPEAATRAKKKPNRRVSPAVALGAIAAAEAFIIAGLLYLRPTPSGLASLPLQIESREPGDVVMIDGRQAGVTPLRLTASSGTRAIRVLHTDPVSATAGSFVPAAVPAPAAEAPAAKPAVPDAHTTVLLEQAAERQRSGGVRLVSPIELQVFEGERVLGSTSDGPIVARAGTHELDIVNNALGYRSRQTVTIRAGQIISMTITPAGGRISANAQPWAQVLIDGNLIGDTPIANFSVPLGEHEIVFRHPQFGDRKEKVLVRAGSVTRVSAILGK
jgi:hypothetical protein